MRSRKQRLAQAVWTLVPAQGTPGAEEYGKWAHKLPVLIRSAGLTHALAFAASKTKSADRQPPTPSRRMLDDLASVVDPQHPTVDKFADHVRNRDLKEYMRLTRLSLEVCVWFKRFAESKLGVVAGESETNDAP